MDQKTFEIIERISKEHCHKTFGYLTEDDLKNEIWIICMEMMKEFSKDKGELEHFLRVGVKNRLINKFRDITKSVRSPCNRCPFFRKSGDPDECKKFHHNRHLCSKWANYKLSVESRNSLLNASEQTGERICKLNVLNNIISGDLKIYIEANLSFKYLNDFQELISGNKISKKRFTRLKKEIDRIFEEKENG